MFAPPRPTHAHKREQADALTHALTPRGTARYFVIFFSGERFKSTVYATIGVAITRVRRIFTFPSFLSLRGTLYVLRFGREGNEQAESETKR